jgi:site-specific DNA recombinase
VVYSVDRLSRDPVHLLLLAEEFDKAQIPLIFVTEPMDNSMEGQLLGFIRGWASKLEAAKIRERTMRGKRMRALSGKLPANSHAHLYGYTYVAGRGIGEGIRYVNESEAKWVREIYHWLVEEKLSTNAITFKLRALGVPTPLGKGYWIRSTVHKILTNPAYCGKTYAFTRTYEEPKHRMRADTKRKNTGLKWKPREEWLEIPGATPPIISEELFETAQRQLERNRKLSPRNTKTQYLLRGHVYCRWCGRSYWGASGAKVRSGKHYYCPFYRCSGNLKIVSPLHCGNRNYSARILENLVWEQVEALLSEPELVLGELRRRQRELNETSFLENDLERIETQLAQREKQKRRIWKAFEITGDEEAFRKGIALLEEEIKALQDEKLNLERRVEASKQFKLDGEKIKKACELVSENIKALTFEEKRLALEALQIKIWIDGSHITIEGAIPISADAIESTPSR